MIKGAGPDSACLLHSESFNSSSKHFLWFAFAVGCDDVWPMAWGSSCYRNEGLCSGVSSNVQWKWSLDTAMVHSFHHFQVFKSFFVSWSLQHLSVLHGLAEILLALNPSWCEVNHTWLKHHQLKHLASSALLCCLPHTVKPQSWFYAWPGVVLLTLGVFDWFDFLGILKYFHRRELAAPSDMHNRFCCV